MAFNAIAHTCASSSSLYFQIPQITVIAFDDRDDCKAGNSSSEVELRVKVGLEASPLKAKTRH